VKGAHICDSADHRDTLEKETSFLSSALNWLSVSIAKISFYEADDAERFKRSPKFYGTGRFMMHPTPSYPEPHESNPHPRIIFLQEPLYFYSIADYTSTPCVHTLGKRNST
jgi:hypothetical protein